MVATPLPLPPRRLAGCPAHLPAPSTDYGYVHAGKMCSDSPMLPHATPFVYMRTCVCVCGAHLIPIPSRAPKSLFCVLLIFSWPRICFHLRFCIAQANATPTIPHPHFIPFLRVCVCVCVCWGIRKQRAGFGSLEIGKKRCQRRSRAMWRMQEDVAIAIAAPP